MSKEPVPKINSNNINEQWGNFVKNMDSADATVDRLHKEGLTHFEIAVIATQGLQAAQRRAAALAAQEAPNAN